MMSKSSMRIPCWRAYSSAIGSTATLNPMTTPGRNPQSAFLLAFSPGEPMPDWTIVTSERSSPMREISCSMASREPLVSARTMTGRANRSVSSPLGSAPGRPFFRSLPAGPRAGRRFLPSGGPARPRAFGFPLARIRLERRARFGQFVESNEPHRRRERRVLYRLAHRALENAHGRKGAPREHRHPRSYRSVGDDERRGEASFFVAMRFQHVAFCRDGRVARVLLQFCDDDNEIEKLLDAGPCLGRNGGPRHAAAQLFEIHAPFG